MHLFVLMAVTTQKEETMLHHQTKILHNQKGGALLVLLIILMTTILLLLEYIFFSHLEQVKKDKLFSIRTGRTWLLESLQDAGGNDMSLLNSRYSINSNLRQCITGIPQPCDERDFYDLALFPAAPMIVYSGGAYPQAPSNLKPVAGAIQSSTSDIPVVFYTSSGERCPDTTITEPMAYCPLQAIARFRPLCGGDLATPDYSIPGGGACSGPAKGIEIYISVGAKFQTLQMFRGDTSVGGDTKTFRYSSSLLYN